MTLLPGAIWVGPINPDNYSIGRQGTPISEIIDHHTDTETWQQALAAFNAQYPSGGGRSAHLIVDRNDPVNDVYQCVDLDDMAWGAANYGANLRGVNIEHVRPWDTGYQPITPGQYAKTEEVHRQLADMYGFPLDSDHVHGHNFYWPTTCPGDMDIGRILRGEDMAIELDPNDPTVALIVQGIRNCYAEIEAVKKMIAALPAGGGGGTEPAEPKTISLTIPSVPGTATGTLS